MGCIVVSCGLDVGFTDGGHLVFKKSCLQGSSCAQGEKPNTSGLRKELGVITQHGEAPALVEGTSEKSPVRSPSEEPTSVSLQES